MSKGIERICEFLQQQLRGLHLSEYKQWLKSCIVPFASICDIAIEIKQARFVANN